MLKPLLGLILIQFHIAATELDPHAKQGLHDTKKLLKTPAERDEYLKKNPRAKEVDQKIDALTGSDKSKEEIYGLASELMEKITLEANGNPERMQMLLIEAQKNPEAFFRKYFNDGQKRRVRGIADDIEKRKTPPPRPSDPTTRTTQPVSYFCTTANLNLVKPACEPAVITGLKDS
ncbi:MAG: hypothetical protein HC902_05530 [Calothrix sp. SM1_5_4]|nr:hypothetical protein [Calothrix sp. SM1_5_4]